MLTAATHGKHVYHVSEGTDCAGQEAMAVTAQEGSNHRSALPPQTAVAAERWSVWEKQEEKKKRKKKEEEEEEEKMLSLPAPGVPSLLPTVPPCSWKPPDSSRPLSPRRWRRDGGWRKEEHVCVCVLFLEGRSSCVWSNKYKVRR